jgi:CHAD domain-containing protein
MSSDDAEAVHTLRITTRRLQELTALAAEVVSKPAPPNTIKAMRHARRACSSVRNADVLLQLIAEFTEGDSPDAVAWQGVQRSLVAHRTRERAKMRRTLKRVDLLDLQQRWMKSFEDWPKGDERAERRIGKRLTKHTAKRQRQFQTALTTAQSENAMIDDIHDLRIAGKRLRYALEAAESVEESAESKALLANLRRFQDSLGEWSDLDMLVELIVEHCGRKKYIRKRPDEAIRLIQALKKFRASQERKLKRALSIAEKIEALNPQDQEPPEAESKAA